MGSKRSRAQASSSNPPVSHTPAPYRIDLPTPEQRNKLAELDGREVRQTLFYDPYTYQMLGIDAQVVDFAEQLGFAPFLNNRIPNDWITTDTTFNNPTQPPLTYRALTLEFLASFEFRRLASQDEDEPDTFRIKFRMFNQDHEMDLPEFNMHFGWDPEAEVYDCSGDEVEGYDMQAWWSKITDGSREFLSNSSKASEIHHAALRYFHRMLVFPFFSRKDVGKMRDQELHLLWRATEGRNYLENDKKHRVNFGYLLALRMYTIKSDTWMKGQILLGGMVTWLAFKLHYKKQLLRCAPESLLSGLNLDRLRNMKFIRRTRSGELWLIRETVWCPIPCEFMSNPPAGTANRWRVPMADVDTSELEPSEIDKRNKAREERLQHLQAHQHQQPPQQQPPQWQPSGLHPSTSEGGMTSSFSFNFEQAFANLSLQINQLAQAQQQPYTPVALPSPSHGPSVYEHNIYNYHVDQGHFAPYVNFPNHPPQEGPVSNWEPEEVDDHGDPLPRTGSTYPYWQGLGTQCYPPYQFPPYNWRAPGGCDYRGDPAYPSEGFPPGFYGGWDPYGPPIELDYDWRPEVEDSELDED